MVNTFRLTYLARGGGGVCYPSSSNLNNCLSDLALLCLTYSPILGLPEYKVKVFNICEMHRTGGREVVVFDQFQRYVEIVRKSRKSAITLSFFNLITGKAQVRCKVTETTRQYQTFVCHW